jgi:8-oxo-dGTP diphosphatase
MANEVLIVCCAIIVDFKKVLVTQRSEQMSLPLKWEFPGGKIKQDETAKECILREIKEELNIEIVVEEELQGSTYDYGTITVYLIPFICTIKAGRIILSEHKESRWLSKEDLLTLDWAPADVPILNQLLLTNYV